jgi:hypothetical protein
MADITKKVDRGVPANERTVIFTQADGGAGDVFLVKASVYKPATRVIIEAAAAMTFRFNVYQERAPLRQVSDGLGADEQGWGGPNISRLVTIKDDTGALFSLGAGETLELDDDMPVSDIEIVTASGIFEITCI